MCGRYATTRTATDLSQIFAAQDETDESLAPDYNLAPTDPAPIVRVSGSSGGRVLSVARWGLVPPWADDPRTGLKMINARAETLATSRVFGPSFTGKRCIVPADGWYEWVRTETGKQAFYMTDPAAGGGLAFAGLWTASKFGLSCTIVTTAALGELARVHDRMPLLLAPEQWEQWLHAPADPALLAPPGQAYLSRLEIRPVGAAVGNVRNDGPELTARVAAPGVQDGLF
ncbi:SOS response-associated peptidase [Catellatospora sp. NPDC049609]|uniref:SOS response-associated peptidase n=1 Tax=Catellatospora sp. NPDC049609 TaxID=3155505 RepID=UPI00341CB6B2